MNGKDQRLLREPGLKGLMGTMMAGAGVTAIVVGFAAKSTLANLISGLSLAGPGGTGDSLSPMRR